MDFSVYIFMIYYCNILHVSEQKCKVASFTSLLVVRNLLGYPRLFYAYQKCYIKKKKEERIHQLHLKPNFIVCKDIVNHFAGPLLILLRRVAQSKIHIGMCKCNVKFKK